MKNLLIFASFLLVALIGTLLIISEPSHTELLTTKQHHQTTYNGKYYKDCSDETKFKTPCSCDVSVFYNMACQAKENCKYRDECATPLVNCRDVRNGQFCGCGADIKTAECCTSSSNCQQKSTWGFKSWKCSEWCKDKQ